MKTVQLSIAVMVALLTGAVSQAADRYNLKIETGLIISESCNTSDGQTQTSHIELLLDSSQGTDPTALTWGVARLRVCSPMTSPVRETIPMPVPVGLMRQFGKMEIGKAVGFDVTSKKFADYFKSVTAPNYLYAQKVHDGVLQLTFIDKASGKTKIGPIRVFVGPSTTLARAKGYSANKYLPISRLEIEIPDKGVTLDANITSVDSE